MISAESEKLTSFGDRTLYEGEWSIYELGLILLSMDLRKEKEIVHTTLSDMSASWPILQLINIFVAVLPRQVRAEPESLSKLRPSFHTFP
jgi:hypothetical protein